MKYVVFTNSVSGIKLPAMFSEGLCHCEIKAGKNEVPTSAGFFDLKSCKAHGFSESLKLGPHEDDADLLMLVAGGLEAMIVAGQDLEKNKLELEVVLARKALETLQVKRAA